MGARRREAVYLAGALPVRLVTSGMGVALALAAAEQLHDVAIGGVLIAVLNAPSVVAASLIGALTDAVRSPKRLMLVASLVLAGGLALSAFLASVPLPLVLAALLLVGFTVPVFMGALSAWVEQAMPGDHARGFAVDALSYNISGIAGPALVAGMSALLSPTGALLALAAASVVGGVLLQLLPITARGGSLHPRALAGGIATATRFLVTHGPIARVALAGCLVLVGNGGMPVVAVLVARGHGLPSSAGGLLLTAFSIGGVAGALTGAVPAVTRRLARSPAPAVMGVCFALVGALTLLGAVLGAVTGSFVVTVIAIGLSGIADAPGIAAMLRLRQQESPPEVRAQVFVVSAGLRAATAAIGAALVSLGTGLDPTLLLVLVALPWFSALPILLVGARRPVVGAVSRG